MGSSNGGRLREDTNPNSNRTDDRFFSFSRFFISILGRFVDLNRLETDNVYCCKVDLKIPVSIFYNMTDNY